MQPSLLLEWQSFPHLRQKLLSKVIYLARSKCSLVVSPLALSDWESELLKGLVTSTLPLKRIRIVIVSRCTTVPRSQWFKLCGRLNPSHISQLRNICSHHFKVAPWALSCCTIIIKSRTFTEHRKLLLIKFIKLLVHVPEERLIALKAFYYKYIISQQWYEISLWKMLLNHFINGNTMRCNLRLQHILNRAAAVKLNRMKDKGLFVSFTLNIVVKIYLAALWIPFRSTQRKYWKAAHPPLQIASTLLSHEQSLCTASGLQMLYWSSPKTTKSWQDFGMTKRSHHRVHVVAVLELLLINLPQQIYA